MDPHESTLRWAYRKYGKPIGSGLFRRVYLESDEYVIKVPFNDWGEYCNDNEALESERDKTGYLARCSSFNHPRTGVILTRMERIVRFPKNFKSLPEWTLWVDCQQVGWTSDGRLVAYDWVYPPV